jgi:hypothetical protein
MNGLTEVFRGQAARLVALVGIGVFYGLARPSERPSSDPKALAQRFRFERAPLTELPGAPSRSVRAVHPSLSHIAAWVSSVGAAVALNDLDGDGLPNDVVTVDPRFDRVVVAPAPGTEGPRPRYEPFELISPLSPSEAPMGTLPGDYNEDGLTDVLVYYWGRPPAVFLRRLGTAPAGRGGRRLHADDYSRFEVAPGSGRWHTNAATLADLDGDGHADLILGNYFPDGARVLDAGAVGVESMQRSMSRADNGGGVRLLLWQRAPSGERPSVRFREAESGPAGVPAGGWTLAVAAGDLDGDLLPELYLANDFGPDRLLHNRSAPGRPRFAAVEGVATLATPGSKVLGHDSFKGMGVDFGDLDGDGRPDIFVSNIAAPYALLESHFVFLQTGDSGLFRRGIAPFVDRSEPLGLSRSDWAWESRLADFDGDGRPEALQATGFVRGAVSRWPELQELAMGDDELLSDPRNWPRFAPGDDISGHPHNPFFVRANDGRFVDIAAELGLDEPGVSRGITTADVDGDGRLDFAVANQWAPSSFYHNRSPGPSTFLGLHLLLPLAGGRPRPTCWRPGHPGRDTHGRPAIGASAAVVLADGRRLAAQVDGGNGHSGKRSPDLLFGFGRCPSRDRLAVELAWRDTDGRIHRERLELPPGWHTVMLGRPAGLAR